MSAQMRLINIKPLYTYFQMFKLKLLDNHQVLYFLTDYVCLKKINLLYSKRDSFICVCAFRKTLLHGVLYSIFYILFFSQKTVKQKCIKIRQSQTVLVILVKE